MCVHVNSLLLSIALYVCLLSGYCSLYRFFAHFFYFGSSFILFFCNTIPARPQSVNELRMLNLFHILALAVAWLGRILKKKEEQK